MEGRIVKQRAAAAVTIFACGAFLACESDALTRSAIDPPAIPDTIANELKPTSGPTPCESGMAGPYPCMGVDLVSHLVPREIGLDDGFVSDMWGWTDPATGTEWALVGHSLGTAFVSLADPANPFLAGLLPLTEGAHPSGWRDIKVYRDHAFVVSDFAGRHGMQVFDLAQLREVAGPPATFAETALYDRIHSAHNLVVNEETGFAYAVGGSGGGESCGGGLHMIDVRDPRSPVFAGCFTDLATSRGNTGYTHDAVCVVYRGPDGEHRGREICFGSNENMLSVADVTDKAAPRALSATSYPQSAYAHQGWLDEAHEYLYMNDELDEAFGMVTGTRTIVWDVRDLDDPLPVRDFIGNTGATDHNLYIVGDLMYQSNYSAGLRVVSIADREDPAEVAFFDLEPDGADESGLNVGTWSNYPFFGSGVIGVTSMDRGVFFLRLSGY